jgi:hypothetical protein
MDCGRRAAAADEPGDEGGDADGAKQPRRIGMKRELEGSYRQQRRDGDATADGFESGHGGCR